MPIRLPKGWRWLVSWRVPALLVVISVYLYASSSQPALAAAGSGVQQHSTVVIVLSGDLGWPSLRSALAAGRMPHLQHWLQGGQAAIGLMNTNTAGGHDRHNGLATFSAGTQAEAPADLASQAYSLGERTKAGILASNLYLQHQGRPPHGQVFLTGMPAIQRANPLTADAVVGQLGTLLQSAGLKTAVLGNADSQGTWDRTAALLVASEAGTISQGDVSHDLLLKDPSYPGGLRVNWQQLGNRSLAAMKQANVLVVSPGDLQRLQRQEPLLDPAVYQQRQQDYQRHLDGLLARLVPALKQGDQLWLASAAPPSHLVAQGQTLVPLVRIQSRGTTPSVLTSATTHRPGIIANTDLPASILSHFDIHPAATMTGQAIQAVSQGQPVQYLDHWYRYVTANHQRRWPLLESYILMQLVVLAFFALFLLYWRKGLPYLVPVLYSLACVPLLFLLFPLVPVTSAGSSMVLLWAVTALLAAAAYAWIPPGELRPLVGLALVTLVLVALDVINGGLLQVTSPLGYSIIGGVRYYGMGNEYLGVVLGAMAVALPTLMDAWHHRLTRWIVLAGAAAVVAVTGLPGLGANFGGLVATSASLASLMVLLLPLRKTYSWLVPGFAVVAALFLILGWNASRPAAATTHIGRAFYELRSGHLTHLLDIARRKLATNWRLMHYTLWSRLPLAFFAVFFISVWRPGEVIKRLRQEHPGLWTGLIASLVGGATGLVVNDSGIVTLATTLIYPGAAVLSLVCYYLGQETSPTAGDKS